MLAVLKLFNWFSNVNYLMTTVFRMFLLQ